MSRTRARYVCHNCGATQPKWMGRCPECGEWNALVETPVESSRSSSFRATRPSVGSLEFKSQPLPLPEVASNSHQRVRVPVEELNRVLGGGIVPGTVILIGGDPGIGKSTLMLQLAGMASEGGAPALYISGEESTHQIKLRAERLGITSPALYLLAETRLEEILAHIETMRPCLAVVDSIQSIRTEDLESSAGSVSQVRECAGALLRLAKNQNVPVFLVGHVTKMGNIAGPRLLEHVVDTVLYLEGDRFHTYRLLRSVKNRFGSTDEVGIFEMRDTGLVEVANPSQAFLAERLGHATGSAIAVTMEGTRPLLVEIQALATRSHLDQPRRTCNGVDFNRLLLLVAVLGKRVGLRLGDQDIFVNVVGGLRIREPAVDLTVATAIASSFRDRPVDADLVTFGEIGLAGELRSVGQVERRLREAAQLGFTRALIPHPRGGQAPKVDGLETKGVRTLAEAIAVALE